MKILLSIESTNPKLVGDRALRWCARLGYELRLFAPRPKRKRYLAVIDDTNYNFYVDVKHNQLVTKEDPVTYAKANGFELLVSVPEDLWAWRKGTQFRENELMFPVRAIGNARIEFGKHPKKRIKHFANGVTMQRV